jgi:hypothetical protein
LLSPASSPNSQRPQMRPVRKEPTRTANKIAAARRYAVLFEGGLYLGDMILAGSSFVVQRSSPSVVMNPNAPILTNTQPQSARESISSQ